MYAHNSPTIVSCAYWFCAQGMSCDTCAGELWSSNAQNCWSSVIACSTCNREGLAQFGVVGAAKSGGHEEEARTSHVRSFQRNGLAEVRSDFVSPIRGLNF